MRTPPGFDGLEHEITGWIRPYLLRGHATINVHLERADADPGAGGVEVDMARASAYASLLRRIQSELELEGPVDVGTVSRLPDVLRVSDSRERGPGVSADELRPVVEQAAAAVVHLREVEGARLRTDLEARLDGISTQLQVVEARAPERTDTSSG